MLIHTTLLAAANPWPETIVVVVALCAVFGWPKFGSFNRGLFSAKQARDFTNAQTAIAHDLTSIRSDLAELKVAVAELDRVLKTVE